uniref:Long-chain acyl-CoA synthetase n=1 Tax=Nannochloropsis gaditana (strain CCMP526) TaxID=1093141 RepID=I2CP03_NANGC
MDRYKWRTLPDVFETVASLAPEAVAVEDMVHTPTAKMTYGELNRQIGALAAFFQHEGLKPGQCVSVFAENSHRWLIADQAILKAGACNAVRGVKAPVDELQYIYQNSESVASVVESVEQIEALMRTNGGLTGRYGPPRFILVLFPGERSGQEIRELANLPPPTQVLTFDEALSASLARPLTFRPVPKDVRSVATLVYTSGTTNKPKGVVLRHSNLLHQVNYNSFTDSPSKEPAYNPVLGDVLVSVLPCWHIFERTAEYWMFSKGIHVVYSNVKNFKADLAKHQPQFIVAVPRLLETIYRGVLQKFATEKGAKKKIIEFFTRVGSAWVKAWRVARGLVLRSRAPNPIERLLALVLALVLSPLAAVGDKLVWSKVRAGLGGRIKVLVAGGSSMPLVLEDFFELLRTPVIVGYGMTETSPVITNRVAEKNLAGSVGRTARDTEVKIVDPESGARLPEGQPGLVLMRGPQMMAGYKSNAEASKAVLDQEGFLDTGDLGRIHPLTKHLIITGRAKDTIVLSNGENVEPQPIEDVVCANSALVDQVMCVGQDEKVLGMLVVPNVRALARAGLVDRGLAERVAELLGGQVLTNGIAGSRAELEEVEASLREKKEVKKALLADIARAMGKSFRETERVGAVEVVLEPFNMANGFLTQTLKVKRNVVSGHYAQEIEQMYR